MAPFKLLSKNQLGVLFGVLAALLVLWLSYSRAFEQFELKTYDWRFSLRGLKPFSEDIVYVDIWDDTLAALGRWPVERKYHAALIHVLGTYGAKAVVFDIEFVEPREGDEAVVQAAKEFGNVYFTFGFSPPKMYPTGYFATKVDAPLLPAYEAVAKGVGFPNTAVDRDGKWRRSIPLIKFREQNFYQLGLRVAMGVLDIDPEKVLFEPGKYLELKKGFRVPLDEQNCLVIGYAGPWKEAFQHYSYVSLLASYQQILDGERPLVDLNRLKGKICLVGLTAQATHDMKPTPLEAIYPGVGIHANVMNTVLKQDFIRRLGRGMNLVILILMAFCTAWVSFYKRPLTSFLYTLAALLIFVALSVNLFIYAGFWMDVFYPVFVCVAVYITGTLTRIMREMRKRELIEGELKIASQIQKSFLPGAPPERKGLDLAVFMQPAKEVGGDLYAFVPLGAEKTGVMVGDVSGKGTPAALFMAKTMSEFKFSAHERPDPADVLSRLNNSIASESTGGLFVTLTYAIFDLAARKMTLANAGHLPVVVARPDGRVELLSADGGMPIGVMPDVPFANLECALMPGECYAFYSDGISEARNRKKEEYGMDALQKVLLEYHKCDAQNILDQTVADVVRFTGKADQHDDMTLIIARIA